MANKKEKGRSKGIGLSTQVDSLFGMKEAQIDVEKLAHETSKISSSFQDLGDVLVKEEVYQLDKNSEVKKSLYKDEPKKKKMPSLIKTKTNNTSTIISRKDLQKNLDSDNNAINKDKDNKDKDNKDSLIRFDIQKLESHSKTLLKNDFIEFKTVRL